MIRNLQQSSTSNLGGGKFGSSSTLFEPTEEEEELSVKEGRSIKCVSVDSAGMPDARIDIGAIRFGDVTFKKTQVDIKIDLIQPKRKRRGLQDSFKLKDEDKYAIGIVTSEVLAVNLDASLLKNRVVLDDVTYADASYNPAAVVDTKAANNTSAPIGGKLAVNLLVSGHYNRNLNIDFDFIVSDSVNRATNNIRRMLAYYNSACHDQNMKIDEMENDINDFREVHTSEGVKTILRSGNTPDEQPFSSACEQGVVLPDFFERSLTGGYVIRSGSNLHIVEGGGGSQYAIIGGAAAAALLLALGIGFLLFQYRLNKKKKKALRRMSSALDPDSDGEEDFYLDTDNVGSAPKRTKNNSGRQKQSKMMQSIGLDDLEESDDESSSSSSSDDSSSDSDSSSESSEASSQVRLREKQGKRTAAATMAKAATNGGRRRPNDRTPNNARRRNDVKRVPRRARNNVV